MPQLLTDDLLDTLASYYQAAARGYRARVEIDWVLGADTTNPSGEPTNDPVPSTYRDGSTSFISPAWTQVLPFDAATTAGDLVIVTTSSPRGTGPGDVLSVEDGWDWVVVNEATNNAGDHNQVNVFCKESAGEDSITLQFVGASSGASIRLAVESYAGLTNPTLFATPVLNRQDPGVGAAPMPTVAHPEGPCLVVGICAMEDGPQGGDSLSVEAPATLRTAISGGLHGSSELAISDVTFGPGDPADDVTWRYFFTGGSPTLCVGLVFVGSTEEPQTITTHLRPKRVSIDKSRRMAASQLTLEFENEAGLIGVNTSSYTQPHAKVRVWQWYGDPANETRTFTGLIDSISEGRDIRTVEVVARDYMKRLIVQTFGATAPQGADETGAVRTPANGVYLNMEVSDIVSDILDQAGWPAADRDITPTSYVLDEYVIPDGASWADAIINDNGPTGLTGYEAGADELGVFYFRPAAVFAAPDSDTDAVPDYTYEVATASLDNLTSRNVLHLEHELDDYDLKTRVKVRGNLATVKAAWTELWHTGSFTKPVGLWYNPADSSHIFVLDRGTKKIYRYKTTSPRDRDPGGIWPLYVGSFVGYPLGLSGDPADSDRFWVLDAAWRVGAGTAASVHKYDASSGAHLAEYALPNGEWSDLKVTSSHLVLTNYGTGKIHLRSKTDGSAVSNATTVYNANNQDNPTGVFADGTTLGLFFRAHARFLLVDESDTTTVDPSNALGVTSGVISTAGTAINGGEMDITTHAHLYACSDDLGLVWKFQLTEPTTTEIFTEVVDTELEDELGFLSGAEDREHDTHPSDADHPFEIRRATVTLEKTITNLAQATETALKILAELARRRETIDFGIVGHPGLQRGDLVGLIDPITGIDAAFILDTYRDNMDERGYLGTAAFVPSGLTIAAPPEEVPGEEPLPPTDPLDPPPSEGTETPAPPTGSSDYLWMPAAEIAALTASGSAWDYMKNIADSAWPAPELDDQDSKVNAMAFAAALVYVRSGEIGYRSRVRDAIAAMIPTLDGSGNGLGPIRQISGWVLAADFISLADFDAGVDADFRDLLTAALTSRIGSHSRWGLSLRAAHGNAENNWGGWAGASRIAADLYLGTEATDLTAAWNVFQGFLGDRTKWTGFDGQINTLISTGAKTWALPQPYSASTFTPIARGADPRAGASASDISRQDTPGAPGAIYPAVGSHGLMYQSEVTAGLVLQAELLARNGHSGAWTVVSNGMAAIAAFDDANGAWNLGTVQQHWPWLVNLRLGTSYPTLAAKYGRAVGFFDWLYGP